jgi:hypothetical protein
MKWFAFFVIMGATMSATAQNLVQNPNFDTDAAGWDLSTYSAWSNRVDHGDSPFSGALQITTRDSDSASQCVELSGLTKYAVSLWVEKDPEPDISPCAIPSRRIEIEFHDSQQCGGPVTVSFDSVEPHLEPDGWQRIAGAFTTEETTQSALLTLYGECLTQGAGVAIHYFDDIVLTPDEIFQADFESDASQNP